MIKLYLKCRKQVLSYFSKHPDYNAFVHVLGGIGIGIFIASPLAFPHPLRWAAIFVIASVVGHWYAMTAKK